MKAGEGWTGAYRILAEHAGADEVSVELEIDIDLARLAKRVTPAGPPSKSAPRYRLGQLDIEEACGLSSEVLGEELAAAGVALEATDKASALDVTLHCETLGPVPNTLLRGVRVRGVATARGRELASSSVAGFGVDDDSARAQAVGRLLDDIAAAVAVRSRPGVELRVESPHPAARVRRLQRVLRDSVIGVRGAKVVGVDADGAVRLAVAGKLQAKQLSRALQALSLPDFSLTIVGIDGPHALTIRLR